MNVSLYQAASAMNANARWQELISENLAASSVPGFKKQELSFTAIQAGLMPHGDVTKPGNSLPFALPSTSAFTNFSGGELKPTGVNTHVALEGPGFFEVQLANGSRAYTRDGEFRLNAQSQLVTKQGLLVMGADGPLQFDPNNGAPISIAAGGEVSQGADSKGTLKVVNYQNPNLLTPVAGGMFEARDAGLKLSDAKPLIREGWLEGSNTSAPAEMAHLIIAMRSFEANQRVVQMHDERMGRLITDLGTTN